MSFFNLFKKRKQNKEDRKLDKIKLEEFNKRRAYRQFNVKGVTRDNRQHLLDTITRKYGSEGINRIELIPEPDNAYDPNAIKIVFEDIGHLGYVPKERAEEINSLLNKNTYDIKWDIDFFEDGQDEYINYMEIRLYSKK